MTDSNQSSLDGVKGTLTAQFFLMISIVWFKHGGCGSPEIELAALELPVLMTV